MSANGSETQGEPCAVYPGGPASMGRVTTPLGDLSFANHYGGFVAMARQLGRQCATDLREGALPFLNHYPADIGRALFPSLLSSAGTWAVQKWVSSRLHGILPAEFLKVVRAFGEGSGYEVERVVDGQLVWDIWGLFAGAPAERISREAERARRHSPLFASSTVVLADEEVGPLHLRWLDNAAVDRWDRKTSVVFYHPDRGIPYALVSSIGLLSGLPAGMNAAGLAMSVEPSSDRQIDWSGQSVACTAHSVLAKAHTIEEAAAVLRESPTLTNWRYILSEGDSRRSAIFDSSDGKVTISHGDSYFVSSTEGSLPMRSSANLEHWHHCRQKALEEVVDRWDGDGHDSVYRAVLAMNDGALENDGFPGHLLCGMSNVGAVLFEPAARRLWVAAGRAPVGRRWFVPMTFDAAESLRGGGLDRGVRPIKPGRDWESSQQGRAMDQLRHACQLDRAGERDERILIILEHALALNTGHSAVHVLVGLMALRVARVRRAAGAFRRARELVDDSRRRAEIELYLAWALDLQRHRRAAKEIYGRVSRDAACDSRVRRQAKRGRRHRFRQRDARTLELDYFLATALG